MSIDYKVVIIIHSLYIIMNESNVLNMIIVHYRNPFLSLPWIFHKKL